MSTTLWLLLAIIIALVVLAVLLSAWALVQLQRDDNTPDRPPENAPDSRTANAAAMARDLRKLRAQVPDAVPRPKVRAGLPASYDAQRPRRKPGA